MYTIELYSEGKEHIKKFDSLNKIDLFITNLFKLVNDKSSNTVIDYGKCWLYYNDELYAVIDCIKEQIRYVSDMKFTDVSNYKLMYNLPIEYHIFGVQAWGDTTFMSYKYFPEGNVTDIKNFIKKFNIDTISNLIDSLQENDTPDNEDADWIDEGMKLFHTDINGNKVSHQYLNKIVFDNMLGIGYRYLTKPLVVYRTWGIYSEEGKTESIDYKDWVSTSKSSYPYDTGDEYFFERFVLLVGFPIVDTCIDGIDYADSDEIIVRMEDLIQL